MNSTRLSPLHDLLYNSSHYPQAIWREVRGMPVPLHLDDAAQEPALARIVALADLSCLPRVVVKGPGAADFLANMDIAIPAETLESARLDGDGLVLRTGGSEFFLEDGVDGHMVDRIEQQFGAGGPPGVYLVLRQDAALVLSGQRSGELLRHVSSYDFVTDPHEDVVFTLVAGVACSVLRRTLNGHAAFRLWTDGTFGIYTWHALLEIALELGGGAVGAAVFYPGLSEHEAKRP